MVEQEVLGTANCPLSFETTLTVQKTKTLEENKLFWKK
jgi:hypothetical protein